MFKSFQFGVFFIFEKMKKNKMQKNEKNTQKHWFFKDLKIGPTPFGPRPGKNQRQKNEQTHKRQKSTKNAKSEQKIKK